MSGVVTLAERHRRKMERIARAVEAIDAALTAYAKARNGRFIRHGSTATGRMRPHSDVDILADFPGDEASAEAASQAEDVCFAHGMVPDVRPAFYARPAFMDRALADGMVLA